jgi:hypothetical protein
MANGHGGPREGSGRKRTRDKFESQINAAEQKIADRLPEILDNLFHLANGGYQRVKEKFELAKKRDAKGRVIYDDKDEPLMEMVCVERTVEIADKDRAANVALMERILGKPAQSHELDAGDGEVATFAIVRVPVKETVEEWQKAAQELQKSQQQANQSTPTSPTANGATDTSGADS